MSNFAKQNLFGTSISKSNPFDSDSESEISSRPSRASSVPVQSKAKSRVSLFDDNGNGGRGAYSASSAFAFPAATNSRYSKDNRDTEAVEKHSEQELENYAVNKAQDTTQKVHDCLKVAEVIREDATQTMLTLHRQGEQIMRTHQAAANIEHDLSVSEKILGSLGGLFSKTWRPKRTHQIKGAASSQDNSFTRTANNMEHRQNLGISSAPQGRSNPVHHSGSPATAMEKVQIEKSKQDDALSDLSNMLGQLKDMAVGMGTEIERQNKALDTFDSDVDELNFRVRGANQQGRRLLGKK